MLNKQVILLTLFLAVFVNPEIIFSQTGKISGTVSEKDNGNLLPGVTVFIEGTQKGDASDSEGRYTILSVEPGIYTVKFTFVGFATYTVSNVEVFSGRTTTIDAKLQLETIQGEEVVVVAEPPLVKKDQTSSVSFVTKEQIEDLPVLEINDLVRFQPGVVANSNGGFNIRGGRTREVAYLVDGVPVQDVFSQGGGQTIDIEVQSVQELQVLTGTFDAELGGAQSGVVNVTTRDPSKRLEANLQVRAGGFYAGDDDIFIDGDTFDPLQTRDVNLTLSGPLLRNSDRLGFFLTTRYEDRVGYLKGIRRFTPDDGIVLDAYRFWYRDQFNPDDTRLIPMDTARTPGGDQILDSQGNAIIFGSGDGSVVNMSYNESYTFNPKIVFFASSRTKITFSSIYNVSESQGYNDSKRFAPDGRAISEGYTLTNIATLKQTLSNNAVVNVRGSYKFVRRKNGAFDSFNDPRYQYASTSDPTTGFFLGGTENGRSRFEEDQIFFASDLTWQINNSNEVKTGFQFRTNTFKSINNSLDYYDNRLGEENRRPVDVLRPTDVNPFFDLYLADVRALQDSVLSRALSTDLSGESQVFEQTPIEFAAFIQDKLEFGSNLVVKAGLRFEYYNTQEEFIVNTRARSGEIGTDANLKSSDPKTYLSPRIGISFPISQTGAFRVAYGHFTQMPAYSRLYQNPIDANTTQLQLEGRTIGNPNLDPERTIKYEVGLQQQISDFIGIDVNLFYKNIRNLLGVQVLATGDGVNYFQTVNRDYGLVKGGTISFFTNPKGYLNAAGFDITYQDAQSSSSNPNAIADVIIAGRRGEEPNVVVDRNIIPLDWDQPLTANAYLAFGKPNNWNVSIIHQLATGQPFTPVFLDENKDFPENFFDNSQTKPTLITLDLSAEKQFNLKSTAVSLRLQVNNILNYLNERTVDSVSGRADQIVRIPDAQNDIETVNEVVGLFTTEQGDVRPTWYSAPREILFSIQFKF